MSALLAQTVGTLEATPFPELLASALDQRLTGTLVLEEIGGPRHGLYFEAGEPRRAKIASSGNHLGEVLVAQGRITTELHRATLERALRAGVLHGQLLLECGFLSETQLETALREQLARQVVWLFAQPRETKYGYFDGVNFLAHWGAGATHVSALELLWRGIRDEARPAEIEQGLARVAGLKLELRTGMPEGHFDFMGDDRKFVDPLSEEPRRVLELCELFPDSESMIKRVLFFLVLTRSVRLAFPTPPPVGLDRRPTPPPSLPPAPRVPKPAFAGTSSFPPARGRISTPVSRSPAPWQVAQRELERISAGARRANSDPALRAAHDATLARGDAERDHDPVSAAASAFQRAEALLARGDLDAARLHVKTALAQDPARPEYIAINVWLQSIGAAPDLRRLMNELDRAQRAGEENVKTQWYCGLALKQLGRHAAALRAFRFVTQSDPHHIDAAREVRLYEQRWRSTPKGTRASLAPEPPSKNPWTRLFGKPR